MNDDTGHKVEALGSWDHAVEPHDIGIDDKGPKEDNILGFLRHAYVLLRVRLERFRNGLLLDDSKLREDYLGHTEEVVAGEKMAVSDVIHQESFYC